MKREIIFRGMELNSDKWIYGDLATMKPFLSEYHCIMSEPLSRQWIKVNPETVGQFSGLILNNVKIYEDDIIKIEGEKYIVSFDNDMFCFCLLGVKDNYNYGSLGTFIYEIPLDEIKLEGNIHSNK